MLRTSRGANVVSVRDGTVVAIGRSPRFGAYVTVRDVEGNQFTYSHLDFVGTPSGSSPSAGSAGTDAPSAAPAAGRGATAASAARTALTSGAQTASLDATSAAALISGGGSADASAPATDKAPTLSVPAVTNALSVLGYQPLAASPPAAMLRTPTVAAVAGWRSLHVGQAVWAGTTLGRVADTGGEGVLGFALQPVGATAPVNPLPFLASWNLRALVLHPVTAPAPKKASPVTSTLASTSPGGLSGITTSTTTATTATAPGAGDPAVDPWAAALYQAGVPVPGVVRPVVPRAGASDLASWGSERMFLLGEGALSREVIADRRVTMSRCLPVEVSRDDIDRRLLAALEYLAASGLDPRVLGGGCDPRRPVEALDITAINGVSLTGSAAGATVGAVTLQRLASLPPGFVPAAITSDPATQGATRSGTAAGVDGIEVRFTPLPARRSSGSAPLATAASAVTAPVAALHGADWEQLSERLNLLGNPGLLRNPALGG